MKNLLSLIGLALLMTGMYYVKSEFGTRRERRCARSEICSNDLAKAQSREVEEPIAAPSGKQFFRGVACDMTCGEITGGYRWARKERVTSENECGYHDGERKRGCLLYLEAVRSRQ